MTYLSEVQPYTPAQVEAITGVNVALQRDYRRRFPDWFPERHGHARYNLFECLQLAFVYEAAALGIGPGKTYTLAEWAAHHAIQYALEIPGAMDIGPNVSASAPDNLMFDKTTSAWVESPDKVRVAQVNLARQVCKSVFDRPNILPNRYTIIFSDGSDWMGPSVEMFLERMADNDPRIGLPMLVFEMPSFAQRVVGRLPHPAVMLRIATVENDLG